jgi:hypothetical protein
MVVVLEPRRRLPLVTVGGTASSLPHLTAADRAGGGRCSGGLGRFAATPIVADHLSSLSLPPSSSSGVVVVVERSRRSLLVTIVAVVVIICCGVGPQAASAACSRDAPLLRLSQSLVSQAPEIFSCELGTIAYCPPLLLTLLPFSLSRNTSIDTRNVTTFRYHDLLL